MTTTPAYQGRVPDVLTVRDKSAVEYPNGDHVHSGSATAAQYDIGDLVRGFEQTEVAKLFFSARNMEALQEGLRRRVYHESGHVVSRQSDRDLAIIMRSMYLQYAGNDPSPSTILPQVRELNGKVLDFCVPQIVNEISMYLGYQRDLARLPEPLQRGTADTRKGTKTLEMWRIH